MGKILWVMGVVIFFLNAWLTSIGTINVWIYKAPIPIDLSIGLTRSMVLAIGLMIIGKKLLDDKK